MLSVNYFGDREKAKDYYGLAMMLLRKLQDRKKLGGVDMLWSPVFTMQDGTKLWMQSIYDKQTVWIDAPFVEVVEEKVEFAAPVTADKWVIAVYFEDLDEEGEGLEYHYSYVEGYLLFSPIDFSYVEKIITYTEEYTASPYEYTYSYYPEDNGKYLVYPYFDAVSAWLEVYATSQVHTHVPSTSNVSIDCFDEHFEEQWGDGWSTRTFEEKESYFEGYYNTGLKWNDTTTLVDRYCEYLYGDIELLRPFIKTCILACSTRACRWTYTGWMRANAGISASEEASIIGGKRAYNYISGISCWYYDTDGEQVDYSFYAYHYTSVNKNSYMHAEWDITTRHADSSHYYEEGICEYIGEVPYDYWNYISEDETTGTLTLYINGASQVVLATDVSNKGIGEAPYYFTICPGPNSILLSEDLDRVEEDRGFASYGSNSADDVYMWHTTYFSGSPDEHTSNIFEEPSGGSGRTHSYTINVKSGGALISREFGENEIIDGITVAAFPMATMVRRIRR